MRDARIVVHVVYEKVLVCVQHFFGYLECIFPIVRSNCERLPFTCMQVIVVFSIVRVELGHVAVIFPPFIQRQKA